MADEKKLVLEASDVSIIFGGLCAVSDFSCELREGGLYGLIGPNGAGKTTLFKLIADAAGQTVERLDGKEGGEKPDSGEIKIGSTVKLVYVDQLRSKLDPDKTVYELLSGGQDIVKLGAVDEKGREIGRAHV